MTPTYKLDLQKASSGYDRETCWVQARCGVVPGAGDHGNPLGVLTMQKLWIKASDSFYDLHSLTSGDDGVTWTPPRAQANIRRTTLPDGREFVVADMTPAWHRASRTLLGTGASVHYDANHKISANRTLQPTYATFDVASRTWNPLHEIKLPDQPMFTRCTAGSAQRWDLDDGRILLPVGFLARKQPMQYGTTVLLCEFDGRELRYVRHGSELKLDVKRGLYEPSVVKFGDRFFLTMRNDEAGYVSASDDGLNYREPIKWTFDDGSELGNYNTQQHWVVHQDGLFLVYTRRGLNNDHVFRHRAPLVMAQIDPDRLCVIRATETVVVPERGARLGNFAIVQHSPAQTWISAAEWMQTTAPDSTDCTVCEKYGSDNTVWIARIHWDKPNTAVLPITPSD